MNNFFIILIVTLSTQAFASEFYFWNPYQELKEIRPCINYYKKKDNILSYSKKRIEYSQLKNIDFKKTCKCLVIEAAEKGFNYDLYHDIAKVERKKDFLNLQSVRQEISEQYKSINFTDEKYKIFVQNKIKEKKYSMAYYDKKNKDIVAFYENEKKKCEERNSLTVKYNEKDQDCKSEGYRKIHPFACK